MKYTAKNHELLKAVENRIGQSCAVNNIEQVVEPESSPQSGVTMLNNIVDKIEQCGKNNIVRSCFQQLSTTGDFLPCTTFPLFIKHNSSGLAPKGWKQTVYENFHLLPVSSTPDDREPQTATKQ